MFVNDVSADSHFIATKLVLINDIDIYYKKQMIVA
jgi:hypothetical protein